MIKTKKEASEPREKIMEAIRQVKKVLSGKLIIDNLEQFSGQQVEIIILPLEKTRKELSKRFIKSFRGCLKEYANPDLIEKETSAWQMAVVPR